MLEEAKAEKDDARQPANGFDYEDDVEATKDSNQVQKMNAVEGERPCSPGHEPPRGPDLAGAQDLNPVPVPLQLRRTLITLRQVSTPGAHPVAGPSASRADPVAEPSASECQTDFFETAPVESCFPGHIDLENTSTSADVNWGGDIYDGKVVPDRHRSRKKGWLVIAVAGMIGALVVLLLYVIPRSSGGQKEEQATMTGSGESNTSTHDTLFSDDLPEHVVSSIKYERDSPFYHANLWLLQDPNLDAYSHQRKMQRFYLAMLFFATNGQNWTSNNHWLSYTVSECEWFSSSTYTTDSPYYEPSICDSNGTFISLSLASNNLNGTLPIWYTSFLPYLHVLDLANNNIGGQLPPLTTSEHLEVIVISNTSFVGKAIINALGTFPNLQVFAGENGKTDGNQGGALYYITPNLKEYKMNGLNFDGVIYSSIGLLRNLQHLEFGHTEAHGAIPSELGLLTDLVHVDLSSLPHVYGSLPSELGLLTKLTWLDLTGTPVTGSVPFHLCDQVRSGLLDMQANCSLLECCL
jgi:hypothetical protein